jgi:hypothetical protein
VTRSCGCGSCRQMRTMPCVQAERWDVADNQPRSSAQPHKHNNVQHVGQSADEGHIQSPLRMFD